VEAKEVIQGKKSDLAPQAPNQAIYQPQASMSTFLTFINFLDLRALCSAHVPFASLSDHGNISTLTGGASDTRRELLGGSPSTTGTALES
jgi:hypothetical protein